MQELAFDFLDLFKGIQFDLTEKALDKKEPSVETLSRSETEVIRFLSDAKKELREAKRLHKQGKISSEELFDHEYRVFELEDDLKKLQEKIDGENLDGDI